MISTFPTRLLISLIVLMIGTGMGHAQSRDYREYKRSSNKKEYFEIAFDRRHVEITTPADGTHKSIRFLREDIAKNRGRILIEGTLVFDAEGLHLDGELFPFDRIDDIRIDEYDDDIVINFYTRTEPARRAPRIRRGNIVRPTGRIAVESDDFVRGFLFSVTGDIHVRGEVNKDVVSLFGDIHVGPEAIVRGDIASVSGLIDASRDASIYGELFSGRYVRGRKRISWQRQDQFALDGRLAYNRVDGLRPTAEFKYSDLDSVLPIFWIAAAYAFEPGRWRFDIGLEQTILHAPTLTIGGSYYRRLASDDDWLLTDNENIVFALLVTEDFKDYYEAEGGTAYLRFRPAGYLTFEGRYRHEETKWLDAERDLFSLFGGSKVFGRNFGTVDSVFRRAGIAGIDTTTNAYLSARMDYDTRDMSDPFSHSAWAATGWIEWSHVDLGSDFDYRRYTINVRRYQKMNRRTMLLMRGTFGGSDGYLPMYHRFYSGGLGTLRGYDHKEYMGTRFWMANAEYRVDFPRSDFALSVLWDAAQIANDVRLDDNVEIRHSLGVAAYLGDDFKLILAKRLDRSRDDNPKIYVRFDHVL